MSRSPVEAELSDRARHLLKVLVERYIRDGQPVGSRTLSRDSGLDLSPATIRNVMADLEEMGLVAAPHTSAGRVPTPKGIRLFVDALIKVQPLSEAEISRLQAEMGALRTGDGDILGSASTLLSALTRMAGVVTVPRRSHSSLRQIEFLPLSDHRILAILVIDEKEVQNRILHMDRDYSREELRLAANYLNEQFAGKSLARPFPKGSLRFPGSLLPPADVRSQSRATCGALRRASLVASGTVSRTAPRNCHVRCRRSTNISSSQPCRALLLHCNRNRPQTRPRPGAMLQCTYAPGEWL